MIYILKKFSINNYIIRKKPLIMTKPKKIKYKLKKKYNYIVIEKIAYIIYK